MAKTTKGSYTVIFEADEEGWWAVSVKEVAGCRTQAKSIRQGRRRIRHALELFVKNARTVALVDKVRISSELQRDIEQARTARKRAEREQEEASALARKVARRLTRSMSVRDAGEVLGLSHQRVQQLVA